MNLKPIHKSTSETTYRIGRETKTENKLLALANSLGAAIKVRKGK